jgi:hypothetical protein
VAAARIAAEPKRRSVLAKPPIRRAGNARLQDSLGGFSCVMPLALPPFVIPRQHNPALQTVQQNTRRLSTYLR